MATIDFSLIERHDPFRTAYYDPKTKRSPTVLDHIRETVAKHGYCMMRSDIAIATVGKKQLLVFATREGLIGDVDFLSVEQKRWCEEERLKILKTVEEYPEMEIFLY